MNNFLLNDSLLPQQWYLNNIGQSGGIFGEDISVLEAWQIATGNGVVIGIVDDGLQYTHPDLSNQYLANLSFDFANNDADPNPENNQFHGTAVAGIAAAEGNNGIGVSGVAYNASLAGLKIVNTQLTQGALDAQLAAALSYKNQDIDIYNSSLQLELPLTPLRELTATALQNGVENGRGGLGNIYVFGSGNDGSSGGNVNYNSLANSRYTIAVGELDHNGVKTPSSNPGASLLVSAYGCTSGNGGLITTDLLGDEGLNLNLSSFPLDNNYTEFTGTSAATPVVSGVIALMLEANPNLTWRDVQHILVGTATQNDSNHPDWLYNGAGFLINHDYGFGAINAEAAVNTAANWQPLEPGISLFTDALTTGWSSNSDRTGGVLSAIIDEDINLEWVELIITPPSDGDFGLPDALDSDIQLILTSPTGTKSLLSQNPSGFILDSVANNWTFTTARHWGESSEGAWTLTALNTSTDNFTIFPENFNWELRFYGADYPITRASTIGIQNGIENGRGGLGNIYVFGAGDNGAIGGNLNYDPLANSRYTIAVGEINANGVKSPSSNPGASLLVSAIGNNNHQLFGTSAAAENVSDVVDLMLEANPNLTWRDVQYILVGTATQNDPNNPDWIANGVGDLVNHDYGFGALDADAAVNTAANWQPLAPGTSLFTGPLTTGWSVNSDRTGGIRNAIIDEDINVEWIELIITPPSGGDFGLPDALDSDIQLILTSPTGTRSILSQNPGSLFDHPNNSWTLTTARHWGESSQGSWTLSAINTSENNFTIFPTNFNWELRFYGADYPTLIDSFDFIAPNTPIFNRPRNPDRSSDVPVFRFQNSAVPGTYLYAFGIEAQNIRNNFPGFVEEGLAFNASIEADDDLIPLFRFQSNQLPGTYLFVGEAERSSINSDPNLANAFTEEGIAFYVYETGSGLGTPVSRFQNSNVPGTYFYTTDSDTDNIFINSTEFIYEGIAFESII